MRTLGLFGLVLATLAISLIQTAYAGNRLSAPALRTTYDDKCKADGGKLSWDGNGLCWRCSKINRVTMKPNTLWCKD
jgi:hypothetical protein